MLSTPLLTTSAPPLRRGAKERVLTTSSPPLRRGAEERYRLRQIPTYEGGKRERERVLTTSSPPPYHVGKRGDIPRLTFLLRRGARRERRCWLRQLHHDKDPSPSPPIRVSLSPSLLRSPPHPPLLRSPPHPPLIRAPPHPPLIRGVRGVSA